MTPQGKRVKIITKKVIKSTSCADSTNLNFSPFSAPSQHLDAFSPIGQKKIHLPDSMISNATKEWLNGKVITVKAPVQKQSYIERLEQ